MTMFDRFLGRIFPPVETPRRYASHATALWESGTAIVDGTGRAIVRWPGPRSGWEWVIRRLGVNVEGAAAQIRIHLGSESMPPEEVRDSPLDPNTAQEVTPIYVPPGVNVLAVVSGGTIGTAVIVTIRGDNVPV